MLASPKKNSGFLKRGAEEVSSEVEGVVTLSVGPRARPAGLRVTAMNTHPPTALCESLVSFYWIVLIVFAK